MYKNSHLTDGTSALYDEYVTNIPWEKSPIFYYSTRASQYIEAFKNALELVPNPNAKIDFQKDVWDFSPYFKLYKPESSIVFSSLPDNLATFCKFFVLYRLTCDNKLSFITVMFNHFKSVYSSIAKSDNSDALFDITTADIIKEIGNRHLKPASACNVYKGVIQMFSFLIVHCKMQLRVDLKELGREFATLFQQAKLEENKLADIPQEYFNVIFETTQRIMRDNSENNDTRMMAASILLLSQIGLRVGDLLALNTESLRTKTLAKSGKTVHFIHYTAEKPSKAGLPLLTFDVYCTPEGAEAFSIMAELRKSAKAQNKNNTLFVLSSPRKNTLPYSRSVFYNEYRNFFYKHLYEQCEKEWKGIKPSKYWIKPQKPVTVSIPTTHQYRVHLCTELYRQNVDPWYIKAYMGHLSETMRGYYVRPKDTTQEDIQSVKEIIQEIAGENLTPLGGNNKGEDIKRNIQEFIQNNNYNICSDINTIVKALGDDFVIRGKPGGVCIRSTRKPCSKDGRTDKLLCAYNICPNLFHFYYMLDVTYSDFKILQETYFANKKLNKKPAADKELGKIKDLIKRKLIPELDELEKELQQKGYEDIIQKHSCLIDVIKNKDEIRKEAEKWMTTK